MGFVHYFLSFLFMHQSRAPVVDFEPKQDGSSFLWILPNNTRFWQNQVRDFLNNYNLTKNDQVVQDCSYLKQPYAGKTCDFDLNYGFHSCTKEHGFGYDTGQPCIFLRINPESGYKPIFYNSSALPQTMPDSLKLRIRESEKFGRTNMVWLDCDGEYPADQENIGPVNYFPDRGFHEKYFPHEKIEGYISPLVAVKFEKPRIGIVINVVCKLWAANIEYDDDENIGIVRFQLLVD